MTFIEAMSRDGYALIGLNEDLKKGDYISGGVLHHTWSGTLESLPQPIYIIEKVTEKTFKEYSLKIGCPRNKIATRKYYYKVGTD